MTAIALGDIDLQAFTEERVMADCGQPNFPFWPGVIALLLLAQIVLLLANDDALQLRIRPTSTPRAPTIARHHAARTGRANAVRLSRTRKENTQ